MNQITLKVKGMSCQHCVKAVKDALEKLDSIESAEVRLEEANVTIHFKEKEIAHWKEVIDEEGYSLEE